MTDYFNEDKMNEFLKKYVPEGQSLLYGVKAVGLEMIVRQVFSYVTFKDEMTLTRSEEMPEFTYDVKREKYATHDIYLGITQDYIVFNECDDYKHAYSFKQGTPGEFIPLEVTGDISTREFGHAQAISDVTDISVKKAFMGASKVEITFSNGSSFKMLIPKKAGIGKGMPNHANNKEKILERLGQLK